MREKLNLHSIAENELAAPAIAWNKLCWYWGMSFLGMAPSYIEYMQSDAVQVDDWFYGDRNEEINHVYGFGVNVTPRQRFERAVSCYEYCFIQGRLSSINPPWDYPPDVETLISYRKKMQPRAQAEDATVAASIDDALAANPDFLKLWQLGGEIQRQAKAESYAQRVQESLDYVQSEIQGRMQLVLDQLDKDSGFFVDGDATCLTKKSTLIGTGVTTDLMDDLMSQEAQWNKLGDVYVRKEYDRKGNLVRQEVVTEGIIGAYYDAGHRLAAAMYTPERIRELSYAHHMTVRTWQQLMEINRTTLKEETL